MKVVVLIACSLLLFSCVSQPIVHVYNRGYAAGEIDLVLAAVTEAGYDARLNAIAVPDAISASSIIYPPIVEDFAEIEVLRMSLADAGHPDVELIYETEGAHFYTMENVGLYLVNPFYTEPANQNLSGSDEQDLELSRIYYSNCANQESQLNLYAQGAAVLEVVEWSERTDRERVRQFDGYWNSNESTITLEVYDEGFIEYGHSDFSGRDDYGRFYGIDLTNLENNTNLESCDFRFITYDAMETLGRIR